MCQFRNSFNLLVLFLKKFFSCFWVHFQCASFFKIDLNGAEMLANSGTNLFNWLTASKNDLNSFELPGLNFSVIPWTLSFTGAMPSPDNLYPYHLIFVQAIWNLTALNCKLCFSNTSNTSRTFCTCTLPFSPFGTIKKYRPYTQMYDPYLQVSSPLFF